MANPYHDAAGRFCSANEMLASINALAQAGDAEGFLQLRGEYEQIRRDIRFERTVVSRKEFDRKLKEFLPMKEDHPPYPLPDAKMLPFSRVRRGLNEEGVVNQQLAQLDNEARGLANALSKEERGTLSVYSGMGSTHVNTYLRDGDQGLAAYLRSRDTPADENSIARYREMAESSAHQLDALFAAHARAETNVRVLYRLIEVEDPAAYANKAYPIGAEVTEASYLSTSIDSDNVLLHGATRERKSLVFEILSAEGLPLHRTEGSSGHPGAFEREVLLNRNSRFKVVRHGEATYETTHASGYPHSRHNLAKKRQRFHVVQLQQVKA